MGASTSVELKAVEQSSPRAVQLPAAAQATQEVEVLMDHSAQRVDETAKAVQTQLAVAEAQDFTHTEVAQLEAAALAAEGQEEVAAASAEATSVDDELLRCEHGAVMSAERKDRIMALFQCF